MTTREEEIRTINQVRTFLYDLINPESTPKVPRIIRLRARRLAKHFPLVFGDMIYKETRYEK